MAKNNIIFIIILVFCLNFASAGLVVNKTSASINKIYGVNSTITFTVSNPGPYPMSNITLENNNMVYMSQIASLPIGSSAQVTAVLYGNNATTSSLKLKGYYITTIGVQNKTWAVNIDRYMTLSVCDLSVVRGDKVLWTNFVIDDIILRNAVTNNNVGTVLKNTSYIMNFDSAPQTFRYYFSRADYITTQVCTISVLPDTGLINNPEYDGILNLSVNIIFNPTVVNVLMTQRNYTISVFSQQDGVLTITNIGNETARGITLTNEWATFSANRFDLAPLQTKGVIYTIKPIISKTEETNRTYDKVLKVTGNFGDINEHLYVTIPFAVVNSSSNTTNYQGLIGLLQAFCKDNPTESFCITTPQVVYSGGSQTDAQYNVSFGQDQIKKLFEYQFRQGDNFEVFSNFVKDTLAELKNQANSTTSQTQTALDKIKIIEDNNNARISTTTFLIIFALFLTLSVLLVSLALLRKRYNNKRVITKW